MLKTLDTTHTLFTREQAEAKAAELAAGDVDWTYTAMHCPAGTGHSFIEIRDEAGELVGRV